MNFLALDLPVLDIIIPKDWNHEAWGDELRNKYQQLFRLLNLRKDSQGVKINLTNTREIKLLKSLYSEIFSVLPNGHDLHHLGGSSVRKLHHIYALSCDAKVTLIGAVSKSKEGMLLREKLKKSGIVLQDFGIAVRNERKALIYTPENGQDRVVLRFPFIIPKLIYGDIEKIKSEIAKNDVVLLEGGRLDIMSNNSVDEILEATKKLKKDIVFFPPTTVGCLARKSARDLMLKCALNSKLMTMNAEEAVHSFVDHKFERRIVSKDDQVLKKAIARIRGILNDKQLVAITMGELGAYGITKDYVVFEKAQKVENIVGTIGAGDAFTGSFIARYYSKHRNKVLKESEISDVLKYGMEVAALVIQQPGSLIDRKVVECMW
jgi:sugar/nucleoside kinase (ribokinase family)